MKKIIIVATILTAGFASVVSGQVRSAGTSDKPATKPTPPIQDTQGASRARVLGSDNRLASPGNQTSSLSGAAKPDLRNHTETARLRRIVESEESQPASGPTHIDDSAVASTTQAAVSSNLFTNYPNVSLAATQIYRVGANDVLDIQIAGNTSRDSTLFTVGSAGLLEFPLAGDPIAVAGLTSNEIAGLLRQRIKIFENPNVSVSVRDYASHAVIITGFVAAPGKKILRREAVPLYAMLAESQVLPEAGAATITRPGRTPTVADLTDSNHAATLVIPGDVIKVSGAPPSPSEFFFIGGSISSPGQKPFHSGLTLTQALLASGGTTVKSDARIRLSRLGPNRRLIISEYNLKKIQTGKATDPVLEKGDRIEVIPI